MVDVPATYLVYSWHHRYVPVTHQVDSDNTLDALAAYNDKSSYPWQHTYFMFMQHIKFFLTACLIFLQHMKLFKAKNLIFPTHQVKPGKKLDGIAHELIPELSAG
jgi:hypothetical protein